MPSKRFSRSAAHATATSLASSHVPFHTGQLERYLPITLAALTAWTHVVTANMGFNAWLAVALALAVGMWSRSLPARHQGVLFARAACLLLCAAVVQWSSGLSAPHTNYYLWTWGVLIGYALLMDLQWALGLCALGWLQFVMVTAIPAPASWPVWTVQASLLVVWPGIAMLFGRSMQRTNMAMELSLTDRETLLYSANGLFSYGAELMSGCQRNSQPISLLLIQCRNIDQVSEALGPKAVRKLLGETVRTIASSAELVGNSLAARTDFAEFALLLPGADAVRAKTLLRKHFGERPSMTLTVDGRQATIMLDTAGVMSGDTTRTVEALYEAARSRVERKHELLEQRSKSPEVLSGDEAKLRAKPKPKARTKKGREYSPTDSGQLSRFEPSPTLPAPLPWERP